MLFNYHIEIVPGGITLRRKWMYKSSIDIDYHSIVSIRLQYVQGFADSAIFKLNDDSEIRVKIRWRNSFNKLIDQAKKHSIKLISEELYHGGGIEEMN
jgi:hypothetical protein